MSEDPEAPLTYGSEAEREAAFARWNAAARSLPADLTGISVGMRKVSPRAFRRKLSEPGLKWSSEPTYPPGTEFDANGEPSGPGWDFESVVNRWFAELPED
jgi:hypothetical protein